MTDIILNIVRRQSLFSYRTDDVTAMMSCYDFSLPVVICIACEIVSLASHCHQLINQRRDVCTVYIKYMKLVEMQYKYKK